jgi:hypothetical protein
MNKILLFGLVLLFACSTEQDERTLVSSADRSAMSTTLGYEDTWISLCDDTNKAMKVEILDGSFKVYELSAADFNGCDERNFTGSVRSIYSYVKIKPTREEVSDSIIYLSVTNGTTEIARLKFTENRSFTEYVVESSTDINFPLKGNFESALLSRISRKKPLKRQTITIEKN